MIENDFNTINPEIQLKKENDGNSKDKRKTLVVFMMLVIGQIMCILNTLINNFTTKTFQYQYPILYNGGFYLIFFNMDDHQQKNNRAKKILLFNHNF